ncbi:MAG: PIN domain-containing protein [Betaproteobacteria bacterium]|nr:PIN domain-containing protein [Betaproteobacteria bacterium]
MTPDINVLVAAFRKDHPHHTTARQCLTDELAAGSAGSLLLLAPVVAGFLRLVTNPKVFADPDSIDRAVAFIDTLLKAPGVEIAAVSEEWPLFRELCMHGRLAGNTIPDAWLAAMVLRLGERMVTFDKGMKKLLRPERLTVLA